MVMLPCYYSFRMKDDSALLQSDNGIKYLLIFEAVMPSSLFGIESPLLKSEPTYLFSGYQQTGQVYHRN